MCDTVHSWEDVQGWVHVLRASAIWGRARAISRGRASAMRRCDEDGTRDVPRTKAEGARGHGENEGKVGASGARQARSGCHQSERRSELER